ncbi:MAG: apolipoprotein N-acyltransferase [Ignavibacteriaceae bacterium]|nr:apolipoprotein N-acyltransferase [Ignavibacteriaceae bacterium]
MNIVFWKNKIPLTSEEKRTRNKDRTLLVVSGILLAVSFPPVPFPAPILLFIALIPYLFVIETKQKLVELNRASYLMGFVFSLFTLYWVGSWQKEADPFLMISGILLIFVNPVFFLIPSTLLYFSRQIFSKKAVIYFLPFFYIAYEYSYMLTDLSFPWLSLGNGLALYTRFIQIADIIGQLGLTGIIVLINVLLFNGLTNFKNEKLLSYANFALTFLILLLILIYGELRLNTEKQFVRKVKVGLIQPNLNPWEKWKATDLNELTKVYLDLSQKAINKGAKIIIWPETALPVYLRSDLHKDILESIHNFVDSNKIYLMTGMPDAKFFFNSQVIPEDAKFSKANNYYYATYNSILLLNPYNRYIESYGKVKLVPFGERVPFVDALPFLGKIIKWGVGISGWNVGRDTTIFHLTTKNDSTESIYDTSRVAGLVCYESIYPAFAAEFVKRGVDFIAVVTNDSWYGNLSGPYQHKEFAVLRAVENRKAVVRAANGGISCVINSLGITEVQSEMFAEASLVYDVLIDDSNTFFTKNPLLIPLICLAFSTWIIGIYILKKIKNFFKL